MNIWTINNTPLDALGVRLANLTYREQNASEMVLQITSDKFDDAAPLSAGQSVVLRRNGVTKFTGKVRTVPRQFSGSSEGMSIRCSDAWHDLERLIYQESRNYVSEVTPSPNDANATLAFAPHWAGTVFFAASETLGDRIGKIVNFAAPIIGMQVGSIASGIKWYQSEFKDEYCANMIRGMLGLMPELTAWVDERGVFQLRSRSNMQSHTFDLSGGNVVLNGNVSDNSNERIHSVVIAYEKPISIDSNNYTEITEDVAGSSAPSVGLMKDSVGLRGGVYQNEYAPIVTETIPKDTASEDDVLDFFIARTPELAAIAKVHGDALKNALEVANADVADQNVFKYKRELVDPPTRPAPINPNSDPIPQTNDVNDYPRFIVEGSLPEWAGKRFSLVRCTATIAIEKSSLDAIADTALKAAMQDIFSLPKTFAGKDYATANFVGEVMGTNAQTRNYRRTVTSDPGETPPTGVAAELRSQLDTLRHSGSITLKEDESSIDVFAGHKLSLTNGLAAWSNMGETVREVFVDAASGETTISFGSTEILGASEMVERLRAARRNTYSYGIQSDRPIEEGIGGTVATPTFSFNRVGGGTGGETINHPWKISTVSDDDTHYAQITAEGTEVKRRLSNVEFATLTEMDTTLQGGGTGWESTLSDGDNYIYLEAFWDSSSASAPVHFKLIKETAEKEVVETATESANSTTVTYQSYARTLVGKVTVSSNLVTVEQRVTTTLVAEVFIGQGTGGVNFTGA